MIDEEQLQAVLNRIAEKQNRLLAANYVTKAIVGALQKALEGAILRSGVTELDGLPVPACINAKTIEQLEEDLIHVEETNPELAAQLQAHIDQSSN